MARVRGEMIGQRRTGSSGLVGVQLRRSTPCLPSDRGMWVEGASSDRLAVTGEAVTAGPWRLVQGVGRQKGKSHVGTEVVYIMFNSPRLCLFLCFCGLRETWEGTGGYPFGISAARLRVAHKVARKEPRLAGQSINRRIYGRSIEAGNVGGAVSIAAESSWQIGRQQFYGE